MGNIKAAYRYDPFPKSGLIKEYEPLIRKTVTAFCRTHHRARYPEVLIDAISIAGEALKHYDPAQGPFGPYLTQWLRGLGKTWWKGTGFLPSWLKATRKRQPWIITKSDIPVTPAIAFRKSWIDRGKRYFMSVKKALIGTEGQSEIRRYIGALRPSGEPGPFLWAEMQATVSHIARRNREDAAERQQREAGDFETVRLDAVRERSRVWFESGDEPNRADQKQRVAAEAIRPMLNDKETRILDGLMADRKLGEVAAEAGIPYRTAKRIKAQLKKKIKSE